eukprot:768624-Hanusia_phi.AAC.10
MPNRKYIFREYEADGSAVERVMSPSVSSEMDSFSKESIEDKRRISLLQFYDGRSWKQGH